MSASKTLRAILTEEGIEFGTLGGYTTFVAADGVSWCFRDMYDGTLVASASKLVAMQAMEIVRGRNATMRVEVNDDGVGRAECFKCGRTVGQHYRYCPWCGARFARRERVDAL